MTRLTTIFAAGASAAALILAGTAIAQDVADDLNKEQLDDSMSSSPEPYEMPKQDRHYDREEIKKLSWEDQKKVLSDVAWMTLNDCIATTEACRVATANAKGVLVFPELTSAGFLVGGTGGRGVLIVDGKTAGYYDLAAASIGFQVGIDKVSQVMAFQTDHALADLIDGPEWRTGTGVKAVAITDGGQAQAIADGDLDQLGDVTSVIFNEGGLAAGVNVEGVRISAVKEGGQMTY